MLADFITGAPTGVWGFLLIVLVIVAIIYFVKRI
jgi:hypothetical protein